MEEVKPNNFGYPSDNIGQGQNEILSEPQVYPQNNQYINSQDIDFNQNKEIQEEDFTVSYQIKRGFIIKTYGIVISQLLISLIFISLSFIPSVKENLVLNSDKNPLLSLFFILFTIITISVFIIFSCCRNVARRVPTNYILLFTFTLCMSFYLTILCSHVNPSTVISALILTIGATLGLTIYAYRTQENYSNCGALLFSLILISIIGFPLFLWIGNTIFYCILGIFIYALYLVYDTQLILGKFGIEYNVDDYCLAALNIYVDIIYLFIRILSLLASKRN